MSAILPTCPTDCSSKLPQALFSQCAPEYQMGTIDKVFITTEAAGGFTDIESPTEWIARKSNTSSNADAIREFYVVGSKPAAESNEILLSLRRIVPSNKKHTLNIKVDETNEINYEFLRQLECGGQYLIWYLNGTRIYGGNDGISASIQLNHVIPESNQEVVTFDGVVKWEDKFHPEVNTYPLS